MAIIDLVETLRTDLADLDNNLFKNEVLERCILKGVFQVGYDLGLSMRIEHGEIQPEPENETKELLLIMGQIHACQYMRAATANAFSFSSGDKRVDKTKQPEHWANLEADLKAIYKQRLNDIKPGSEVSPENYIISPANVNPVIFEQGKNL